MWTQLHIEYCNQDAVEPLSDLLQELGALSVMLTDKNDDPVLEPTPGTTPLWPEVIIQALFEEASQAEDAKAYLAVHHPSLVCTEETLVDRDWERVWMDDFKPQQFGTRLWICPTTCTPPDLNAVNVMLDPGLAFGTGTHPTTALCLNWLEKTNLSQKNAVDYGCGSGILAVAALKLGAKSVHAVDIDKQALIATTDNALKNEIESYLLNTHQAALEIKDTYHLLLGYPESLHGKHDIILANILLAPLLTLVQQFHKLLEKDGILVVSGLLEEQVNILKDAYQTHFTHQNSIIKEGWALVEFKRL